MISAIRQQAVNKGITVFRLIQLATGAGLEESVLIEHVLAYASAADGMIWKSQSQWQHELGIQPRAIRRAHQIMEQIGISVSVGPAGGLLRVTRYAVDWPQVAAAILSDCSNRSCQNDSIDTTKMTASIVTERQDRSAQNDRIDHDTAAASIVTPVGASIFKESVVVGEREQESLTTTTAPTAFDLLTNAGVYPTIANRFRDKDPVHVRRLIHYANQHAKLPAGFIATALGDGFVPPPTLEELYEERYGAFIER